MVAARVQCEGGPPTETFKKCLDEVQSICSRTLFSPVTRQEVVQAMGMLLTIIISFFFFKDYHVNVLFLIVLVSGWSDNGWLSGGTYQHQRYVEKKIFGVLFS